MFVGFDGGCVVLCGLCLCDLCVGLYWWLVGDFVGVGCG